MKHLLWALAATRGITQLTLDGKPLLLRGGELENSTASDLALMESVWPKLKAAHFNTVLAPVTWELVEPQKAASTGAPAFHLRRLGVRSALQTAAAHLHRPARGCGNSGRPWRPYPADRAGRIHRRRHRPLHHFGSNSAADPIAGIERIEEGHFVGGTWKRDRVLNGDDNNQGRNLRLPAGQFVIRRVRLYRYH